MVTSNQHTRACIRDRRVKSEGFNVIGDAMSEIKSESIHEGQLSRHVGKKE